MSSDPDEINRLRALVQQRRQIDDEISAAILWARSLGTSWGIIAACLGVTRQAAWERWHE